MRLQRADENDARQVAAILSELRDLSHAAGTAVALVHHVRKERAHLPGQALRESGDFWLVAAHLDRNSAILERIARSRHDPILQVQ